MAGSKTPTIRGTTARRLLLLACVLGVLLVPAAAAAPGTLDASFGAGGRVTTSFGTADDDASAVALQPDGKIVAAGYAYNGPQSVFALVRYNADGSLDTSFNGTGKVTTVIGGDDYAEAVTLQGDGKIIVAGTSSNGSNYDFAVARYNADGSLDTSFNGSGMATTAFGPGLDIAYTVALQPDGKIVTGGYGSTGSKVDFALARFNTNGSLDSSFGTGGKVTTAVGSDSDIGRAIALQPDGKIVAAGYSAVVGGENFALVRYNANGTLDSGFGAGGIVTTAMGNHNILLSAAVQPDGRIVAAGDTWDSPNIASQDFALIRLNPDGALDPSFGSGGKIRTSIGPSTDAALAIALQPDGKIVAAGKSTNGATDFALVRYLGSSLTVTRTGSGSGSVTSSPSGIDCGDTCSAPFAAVPVTLTATPAAGSTFVGWSGDCSGAGTCTVTPSTDHTVTATFEKKPPCIVPKVIGKTLKAAKKAIERAHCTLGKVTKAYSATVKKGHVGAQKPRPGSKLAPGAKVRLKVSKGKKS